MKRKRILQKVLLPMIGITALWLLLEFGMRYYLSGPLKSDFYGSILRDLLFTRQDEYGIQVTSGSGWIHLGWIADHEGESYRLVFHSDNPYDFGVYRGRDNSPTLLTQLETHAPEFVYVPNTKKWYITTAGWPYVASLTSGEVAFAPLEWEPIK
jgi:hypothetical protein